MISKQLMVNIRLTGWLKQHVMPSWYGYATSTSGLGQHFDTVNTTTDRDGYLYAYTLVQIFVFVVSRLY